MSQLPKIYVAGHRGMVGSAIVRHLIASGYPQDRIIGRTHAELDLTNQSAVRAFFEAEKPDQVYLAAAKVGGIYANSTYPAEFIYENLMVQTNVVDAAFRNSVKKLLFLGSSCIYPKLAPQPINEEALLKGELEPTNEPYAIAKIAGIKLCESFNRQYGLSHGIDYRSVMPTNLYGPGDNYHPEDSHVIPALIRRFHEAKETKAPEVAIWGSGATMREFLYVDDIASASVCVMNWNPAIYNQHVSPLHSYLNVGSGTEISIKELAQLICRLIGYKGNLIFDSTKPSGTPRKLLDSGRLRELDWEPKVSLASGLRAAYDDFLLHWPDIQS